MSSEQTERSIHGQVLVPAPIADVWAVWTTEDGIRTFFAPGCHVDVRPDGPYEIFFDLDAPPGQRGGEGLRVMAVQPMTMLSFTWGNRALMASRSGNTINDANATRIHGQGRRA